MSDKTTYRVILKILFKFPKNFCILSIEMLPTWSFEMKKYIHNFQPQIFSATFASTHQGLNADDEIRNVINLPVTLYFMAIAGNFEQFNDFSKIEK